MTMRPTGRPAPAAQADLLDGRVDVAVIGAGQAGLAIGYLLARQGRRFLILEAGEAVGSAWRSRWDSLLLFTPRRYDALPGLAFPGDPDGYPTRDEVISYLEEYADTFGLPITLKQRVHSLGEKNGRFVVDLRWRARRGGSGRGRHRTVPGAQRAVGRRPACARSLPGPQHGVSLAGRRAGRARRGRGRRQHRLSNRQGALGDARGSPGRRLAPEAPSAEAAGTRRVLVAHEARAAGEDR